MWAEAQVGAPPAQSRAAAPAGAARHRLPSEPLGESERDHWPIMEVLTAYVREHAPAVSQERAKEAGKDAYVLPATDVQAVLTVIGRRSENRVEFEKRHHYTIDLHRTDLRGAALENA